MGKFTESRALPGGMLNSKEKTEYEDWLEKLHKDIDSIKPDKDTCSMPLMDAECGAPGCHNYDGTLMTDKNRAHGIYNGDDLYTKELKKDVDAFKESLDFVRFIISRFTEGEEDSFVNQKKDLAIKDYIEKATSRLNNYYGVVEKIGKDVGRVQIQNIIYDVQDCINHTIKTTKEINKYKADKNVVKSAIEKLFNACNRVLKQLSHLVDDFVALHNDATFKNYNDTNFDVDIDNIADYNKEVYKAA